MKHYTKEEILTILKRHENTPVAFTAQDAASVLANPALELYLKILKDDVEAHKSKPVSVIPFSLFRRYDEDGNRKQYEDVYFERRQKLLAYTLHLWLYEDSDVLAPLQDTIWAILEEYTWCLPAHLMGRSLTRVQDEETFVVDLFAAETGHALAETLSLVGDKLHPIVVSRIHKEIERRIFARAYQNKGEFFWHTVTNNWSAVCSGAVGMAAIYEIRDTERLAEILETSLSTLENFYRGFPEDGTCLEGLSYWNYGFGYFMSFADMLFRYTDGEIDLFADEHVKNIALFYTKMFFKGSRTVSFSDGGTYGKCALGALGMLKRHYPDFELPGADYITFGYSGRGCARFALTVRDAVYALPEFKTSTRDVTGTYILPDAAWYISSSKNGVGIAAKAGHNDEPHNHNDVGAFLIYKNGMQIIADIGSGEYTKQYFSKERYDIFCNSSASHSVPIVNGEYQKPGKMYAARDVSFSENGLSLDLAGAYGIESLSALRRSIVFDKESGVTTVSDSFRFDERPVSVTERFVAPTEPEIFSDRVEITVGNEKMAIYYEAEKCTPKSTLVVDKSHLAKDRETYVIDFELISPAEECDLSFIFK